MSRLLTVSRAAQLVGVSRGRLQRMIRSGELASFDGLVDADVLLRSFPEVSLDDAGLFEKVARIREESFGRRIRERALPSAELLAQRLFAQSRELAEVRRHLQAYHGLVVDVLAELRRAEPADWSQQKLVERLERGLAGVLGSDSDDTLDAMTDMLRVVSANVRVRPSGREFLVEGNDSILQAGLKAGLRFSYGCGGGNCGLCKARLVSGEVRPIAHADYRLSEAERRQGVILMCNQTALGDLVIETLEASGPADIPEQEIVARVRAVSPLGADTLLLHLQTPRSDRLRFLAGQGVTLGAAGGDGDAAASYPLASCPCDDRNLHFHVARDPSDPFAARLFEAALGQGDPVNVRGPIGDFVLEADSGRVPVFVACDTGFGPVKSLIEHAIAAEDEESIALYWVATRADGHYLANQCLAWASALDDFRFVPLVGADAQQGATSVIGQIDRDAQQGDAAAHDYYVAGPPAFVAAVRSELVAIGVPAAQVRALEL